MKKYLFTSLIYLSGFLSNSHCQPLGVNYTWTDSATVGIIGRDSTFTRIWEEVNVWCRGGEGWIRIGAPDTSGWASRKFIRLADTQVISFGPGTRLRRIQFKSMTGTVIFFFSGYKKRWQVGTGN